MQRVTRCRIGKRRGGSLFKLKWALYAWELDNAFIGRTRPGLFLARGTVEREQNADVMAQCRVRGRRVGELVIVINSSKEVNGDGAGKGGGSDVKGEVCEESL